MDEPKHKFKDGQLVAEIESTDKKLVVGYMSVGNEFWWHFYGRHPNQPLPEKVVCKWINKEGKEVLGEFDEDQLYLLPK